MKTKNLVILTAAIFILLASGITFACSSLSGCYRGTQPTYVDQYAGISGGISMQKFGYNLPMNSFAPAMDFKFTGGANLMGYKPVFSSANLGNIKYSSQVEFAKFKPSMPLGSANLGNIGFNFMAGNLFCDP